MGKSGDPVSVPGGKSTDPASDVAIGDTLYGRTMSFDKLRAVMSCAQVEEKRAACLIAETEHKEGFYLLDSVPAPKVEPQAQEPEPTAEKFEAMAETLKAGGVQTVAVSQLFPTPPELAARMVGLAGVKPGQSVLEPSGGTGNILLAIKKRHRCQHHPDRGRDQPAAGRRPKLRHQLRRSRLLCRFSRV